MPLWFIRELMFFSLLAPVVCWLKRSLWLSVIVSIVLITLSVMNIVGYRCFLYWLPIYLMGASLTKEYVARVCLCYSDLKNRLCMILLLLFYCVWAWFLPNGAERENVLYGLEYSLFRIATPVAFSIIVFYMIQCMKFKAKKWMSYSFFVYCLHAPMLTLVGMGYTKVISKNMGGELLQYSIVIGLTYALCVWSAMFLEHFFPSVWGILNGKRIART